ncbi:MAG: sulfurtransferase [Bacteroidetes bacterium]|nr:sulfurtransferase [Bacteroidota bacterium]
MEELIRSGKAAIIDVRSHAEYISGHVKGSLNIPLQEIPARLEAFKKMKSILLCCASGNRSGQACAWLQQNGIECVNAGSWMDINALLNT